MAQTKLRDLKLDLSRDYQPITRGPDDGFFTFQAQEGAGGKRIAAVAYLIPVDGGGEYTVELANKQEGKGRLSAYNQTLAQNMEDALLNRLRADLHSKGWRETITGTWLSPEKVKTAAPTKLKPAPVADLTPAAAPLEEGKQFPDKPTGKYAQYYDALHNMIEAADSVTPGSLSLVRLPKDVYLVLMHGHTFRELLLAADKPEVDT